MRVWRFAGSTRSGAGHRFLCPTARAQSSNTASRSDAEAPFAIVATRAFGRPATRRVRRRPRASSSMIVTSAVHDPPTARVARPRVRAMEPRCVSVRTIRRSTALASGGEACPRIPTSRSPGSSPGLGCRAVSREPGRRDAAGRRRRGAATGDRSSQRRRDGANGPARADSRTTHPRVEPMPHRHHHAMRTALTQGRPVTRCTIE